MRFFLPLLLAALFAACDPYPETFASARSTVVSPETDGKHIRVPLYPPGHFLAGDPISSGTDYYGYNYPRHSFRGVFENRDRGQFGLPPVTGGDVTVKLRWNEAWLSSLDRDGDGVFDRHPGFRNYRSSGAWLTVQMEGGRAGNEWEYVMKVAAVPADARLKGMAWEVDGARLGTALWGCFAVVFEYSSGPEGFAYADRFKHRFPGFGLE